MCGGWKKSLQITRELAAGVGTVLSLAEGGETVGSRTQG